MAFKDALVHILGVPQLSRWFAGKSANDGVPCEGSALDPSQATTGQTCLTAETVP
jgi:hypothetical protein